MEVGNDNPNTLRGTFGDNKGQDTLFGLGAGDTLIGRSAADQLAGGPGADRLEGNDTLVGGPGEDRIFTGKGFDFVFAFDGDRDVINCDRQGDYRINFDENLDRLEQCPGANTGATRSSGKGSALSIE